MLDETIKKFPENATEKSFSKIDIKEELEIDAKIVRPLWLNQGFLVAWQRCLNQFGIWQQLVATQSKDNERAVVNLRHLTDILSQHSEHVQGAQNLYHWYLKQLNSPSNREWELEHKLSSEAGVQLMTIHQSKGLEFKIVFLLGANKAAPDSKKEALNFSTTEIQLPETGQTRTQRVVAIADKNFLQQNYPNNFHVYSYFE